MRLRIKKRRTDSDEVVLAMTGELTIYTVSKLKGILLDELKAFSGIILNLSEIDDADTAGFQLLLFLEEEAKCAGKTLIIDGASERVKSIFSLYGEQI